MAQIITLPTPDKDELDAVLKEEKNATKSRARREFLEKRDNLLQRIQKRNDEIMSGKKTLLILQVAPPPPPPPPPPPL